MNYRLLVLLERVLGKGRPTAGTNVAFFSPFCKHYKPKLEINLSTVNGKNPWHCWISNERGRTIHSLFFKLKVNKDILDELNDCLDVVYPINEEKYEPVLELPRDFIPIHTLSNRDISNPDIKNGMIYLRNRGITMNDIKRYNIGICIEGDHKNRIIIPSYDNAGYLNYFISRTFLKNEYIKYKNPRYAKNIIPFDMYVNWELPIYLVEGVFDAIAVKFNAIPLLGKSLSSTVKQKIIESRPPMVYIALDSDAIKSSIKIASELMGTGIDTSIIQLNGKDPSEIGHFNFFTEAKRFKKTNIEDMIRLELSI